MAEQENIVIGGICERAVELFNSGWNCAEAVFLAISEVFALDKEVPVNLLTGLGGGVGDSGFICGALTGAIVSVGIKYGRKKTNRETKERAYRISGNMLSEFKNKFQSIDCSQLSKDAKDKAHKKRICSEYVREAAALAAKAILAAED